jgi:broad specificity phosphatase PhoE
VPQAWLAVPGEFTRRHPDAAPAIVTRGPALYMLYRAARGIELGEPRTVDLVSTGINQVRFDTGAWHVEVWGDGSHRDEILLTPA